MSQPLTGEQRTARPGGANAIGFKTLLGTTLAVLAALAMSPTTYDYLILSFSGLRLPMGTAAFGAFVGLTAILLVSGQINRRGMVAIMLLLAVSFGLAMTSLWSESTIYLQLKLPLVLGIPALLFGAGFYLAATGHLRHFAVVACTLCSFLLLGIWIFGVDQIVGFQTGLEEEFGGRYQSISRVMAVAAVMFAALGLSAQKLQTKALLLGTSAVLLLQVLYTGGRVGLLIIAIALPLVYLSTINPRWRLAMIVGFLSLATFFVVSVDLVTVASAIWPGDLPLTIQRVLIDYASETAGTYSLLDRANLWRLAFELWNENPIFGVGLAGFPVNAGIGDTLGIYPHNIILELASETGIFGLFLFLAFVCMVLLARPIAPIDRQSQLIATGLLASGVAISGVISDFGLQRELFMGLGLYFGLKFPDSAVAKQVVRKADHRTG